MSNKITETQIQKRILEWLNFQPYTFAFRTNNIGVPLKNGGFRKSPTKGLSDIICVHRGVFLAVEVKRPGCKATKDQQVFLNCCYAAGGVAFVADSVDDVRDALALIDDYIDGDVL